MSQRDRETKTDTKQLASGEIEQLALARLNKYLMKIKITISMNKKVSEGYGWKSNRNKEEQVNREIKVRKKNEFYMVLTVVGLT